MNVTATDGMCAEMIQVLRFLHEDAFYRSLSGGGAARARRKAGRVWDSIRHSPGQLCGESWKKKVPISARV